MDESEQGLLGVGIIGFGGFGQFLRRSWSELRSIEVRAVSDSNEDRAPSGLRFYADWHALLDDPAVDIISIATPPATHAEMACAAMRAGKHVLIEKPLATTRDDAARIREVQAETGCVAAVDYMLRFNPIVETLHDWARRKPFGPLRRVTVENYAQDEALPFGHWFWDLEASGGILVEHAVHFIDIVHGCTEADAASIDGLCLRREDGRIDRMGLTVVYEDGLVMQQYHSFTRPGFFEDTSMRFVFDVAQVEVHGWIPLNGRLSALLSDEKERYLQQLPGLTVEKRTAIEHAKDLSRPDAWETTAPQRTRSGATDYAVDTMVQGSFTLAGSKSDAYASALRSVMADVVAATRDRNRRVRCGLPEGERSLHIALAATEKALAAS